ncbi:MAG: hypothetical protein ACRD6I_13510 [Candidatus Acidiferrales bacterium]
MKRSDFEPVYLRAWRSGALQRDAEEALAALADCPLCPRDCHGNRLQNKFAVCKTGRYAVVGSHFPHRGEEDCLRGSAAAARSSFPGATCAASSARTTS